MFLRLPCMGGTGTLTKQLLKLDEPFNHTQEFWDFMDTECGTAPSESGGTRNAAQGQAESHTVGYGARCLCWARAPSGSATRKRVVPTDRHSFVACQ